MELTFSNIIFEISVVILFRIIVPLFEISDSELCDIFNGRKEFIGKFLYRICLNFLIRISTLYYEPIIHPRRIYRN